MGILGWFFGRKERPKFEDGTPQVKTRQFGSTEFLEIPSRNFFGLCCRSPNRRYTLVWRDGNDAGTHAGARHSGHGRYILLERDKIIAEGRMARPNDGKVADNGVFILNDWEFSDALSGTFFAFTPDGRPLVSRKYKANLFNNGLAPDAGLAVCQTCNSPDSQDSSILTTFDLVSGTEIASWRPESGWANFYEFPPGAQIIRLGYTNGGTFDYRISGEFVDRDRWIDFELRHGNLFLVENLLKNMAVSPPQTMTEKLLAGIDVALAAGPRTDSRTQAWGLKLRGMCLEAQNAPSQALTAYEQALSLDPKVGVKRRADQLRKAVTRKDNRA